VGYSLDRGVEQALGDIVVIMGADVFPERGWLEKVKACVADNEIGCACSVGLQPGNYDINAEGMYLRYGASIKYTLTVDDLPKHSELRKNPNHKDILEPKWEPKRSDEPYEIENIYGAFYWLKRDFYEKIHGWDTQPYVDFRGHMAWGCLETMLSIKVYGGKCMMYPDIKAGHIFGRIGKDDMPRSIRGDLKWWNKLWVAHTMLDDSLRDELLAFPEHSLNFSQAKAYIKQNWSTVQEVRERNKREGKLISK
jgi:hypothetical protein